MAITASYKDFNSTIFGELKKIIGRELCERTEEKRKSSFQSWNFSKTLELDWPRARSKCCWASLASQQDQKRPPSVARQRNKAPVAVAWWQEAWKTAHSDVLPSAAALWGAVRRATQQMCERLKCTFILRPILPVGKMSFSKIRHCNLGHPSCHGKSRLWQHNGDLALSTAEFFPLQ